MNGWQLTGWQIKTCALQDYLFSYRDRIQAVTAQDVLEAAKAHLHPLEQVAVVVVDAEASAEQLGMQGRAVVPLVLDES